MPMPQLKVRASSSGAMPPARASQANTGGSGQQAGIEHAGEACRQHAGDVLDQPAAGDVRQCLQAAGGVRGKAGRDVDAGRGSAGLSPSGRSGSNGAGARQSRPAFGDHLADQRIAVGVQAAGGEAEDDVAHGDVGAGEQPAALDRAHGEAGEIVVALGIEPGHLRRLAADQRATGLPAPLGDAGNDGPAVLDHSRGVAK